MERLAGWRAAAIVALLTFAAFGARLATLDYGLPFAREADTEVVDQVLVLARGPVHDDAWYALSAYPVSLARTVLALGLGEEPELDSSVSELALHLDAAARPYLDVRFVVALFSVLLVPATWWLARSFLSPPWAWFAAALVATSMLALQFGRMARPHAFVAPWMVLAVVAWVRFAASGGFVALVLASLVTALAIGSLPNGLATLLPAAAAWWMQPKRPRWLVDARLLVPLLAIAAVVRFAYPFWFVEWPSDPNAPSASGVVHFGWQQAIDPRDFDGRGFSVLARTFAYYEPVALALACVGAVAFVASAFVARRRGPEPEPEPEVEFGARRARLVVLAFAVPYALVLGLFAYTQQRFALPLVPCVAVLAAYGARAAWTRFASSSQGRAVAGALVVAALALPAWAVWTESLERLEPHPFERLAEWVSTHVDREHERVALHAFYDLPLVRTGEHFAPRPGLALHFVSPWLSYQRRVLDGTWRGERWDIAALYPEQARWRAIAEHADEFVRGLDADYVVVPCGGERLDSAPASAVRDALRRTATLVFALHTHPESGPISEADRKAGAGRFRVLLGESTRPEFEIYALERRRDGGR
ncbi:MAG: glycosyltransferase family 39 protein [Planctomycetes bacterium]|nr:glycosyltransferase family 39 protein [Planctomycetota bacterium]